MIGVVNMISLFVVIYLLCGLTSYGLMMWAINTDLTNEAFSGVDDKIIQGLLKVSEKYRNLTMIEKFVLFLMAALAPPVLFIVLIVMKKRGEV